MFPPDGWSLDFGTRDDINFDFPPHGNYYYASQPDSNFFGAVSDTLFTPLLDIAPGDQLHMRVKASAFLAGNHSVVWKNGTTGAIQVLQTFSTIPEAWDPVSIDLSAAAGINYIGIVTQQNGPALTKYDLFTSDAQRHFRNFDLAIGEEDIYFLARKGQSTSFPLTVKNQTAQLVSGGSYTVKLMEAPGVLLATVNGVALGPWEEVNLSLSHTYNALAAHDLYFEIDYGQDEDLTNNQSWQTEVHVVPATVILNDIGQPDFQNLNFPFNGNGNTNSLGEDDLSQSLYYSQEFAAEGNLYGMIYTYDNALNNDAIKHLPLKVWVAQTQAADLSGGWIPNNQLTLVFDDTLEILPGTGREVYIPFDNPLVYTGIENLVVQDYVYDPEWPPAILSFYAADQPFGGAVRTISVNDVYALDPLNPPAGFFQSEDHVYTTFVLEPVVDTGLISGTVYSTNNVALGNVEIAVQGTSLADSTDMNGQYALPYLPYGSYTLKASYPGYNDTIVVVQLDTAALLLDLYLRERTQVSITGTVSGSNDPGTPLEFVSVLAEGYTVDSAMTDASGQFSLANIFGVSLYSVQLQRQGYYDTTLTVQVTDSNINLGNVVMRQEFLSPFEVAAVNQGTAAYVVWRSPLEIAKVKLQNDLGVCSFSYTNSPSENVWLGNRFAISGPTTLTSVEIHTDIYELDSDFVRMDVFDATTEEILASSAPFLIYNDTVMVIGIPNIVVFEDIFVMLHWENNVNSTHALCVDFSDPNVPNTALVKYPGQPAELFSTFLGQGAPNLSFLVRVNTLQAGTTVGVAQPLTYNLYRGLADEFPDTQNWTQVNAAPVAGLTFLDSTWTSQEVSGEYRYAVETIYPEGNSALTFSNPILWTMFTLIEDLAELQVQVYPNPATDFLIVELETKLISRAHLRLLDVRGRLVDEVYVPSFSKTIRLKRDVSQLAQGIYFVQIETEDHQVLTQRIVIR